MAGGSYIAGLRVSAFMLVLWMAGKGSAMAGVSSIVAEIAVGVALGPQGLELIPPQYSIPESTRMHDCEFTDLCHTEAEGEYLLNDAFLQSCNADNAYLVEHAEDYMARCEDLMTTCAKPHVVEKYADLPDCVERQCRSQIAKQAQKHPDVWTLLGQTGVSLMIFESGMHFDFSQVRVVGPKALVFATVGTTLPIIAAVVYCMLLGYPLGIESLAAGVSLSPTSVGIALKLLMETGQLQSFFGQAIITGAFIDDIMALIAFGVLVSVGTAETFSFQEAVLPGICGVIFLLAGAVVAAKWFPAITRKVLQPFPEPGPASSKFDKDAALLLFMVLVLVFYASIAHVLGAHLWGCFIGGMSFAGNAHAHHIWVHESHKLTSWLLRIFFGCTVAFAIPVEAMLSPDAFLKGLGMGLIPCIGTKVFCAPNMGEHKWLVGWAMVGRAEFAYLIAQDAYSSGMMGDDLFSIIIWSLLWATVLAPFVFRKVLMNYAKRNPPAQKEPSEEKPKELEDGEDDKSQRLSDISTAVQTPTKAQQSDVATPGPAPLASVAEAETPEAAERLAPEPAVEPALVRV